MSNCLLCRKGDFIVVQNGHDRNLYYTVVNCIDKSHSHIRGIRSKRRKSNAKTAKIVCSKANKGEIKAEYPYFMRLSIFRILGAREQLTNIEKVHPNDFRQYYKGRLEELYE